MFCILRHIKICEIFKASISSKMRCTTSIEFHWLSFQHVFPLLDHYCWRGNNIFWFGMNNCLRDDDSDWYCLCLCASFSAHECSFVSKKEFVCTLPRPNPWFAYWQSILECHHISGVLQSLTEVLANVRSTDAYHVWIAKIGSKSINIGWSDYAPLKIKRNVVG